MSTVTLNGTAVDEFLACNRMHDPAPVAVTVTATVELSTEDLVVALFRWITMTFEELDNDDTARLCIAESVLNAGLADLRERRPELAACVPGTDMGEWAQYCRRRVAQLYGTGTGRRPVVRRRGASATGKTTAARELVTS